MKTSELLIKAKALIDTHDKWTQEVLARDVARRPVGISAAGAVCFCSMGALELARRAHVDALSPKQPMWGEEFLDQAMEGNCVYYNDNHTHAEVMQGWDRAIQLAQTHEKQ